MNVWERGICSRVKELREAIKWQQPDFAAQIGITLDRLASIEYGRTPLRYDLAWTISVTFAVSLEWLAEGRVAPDDYITLNFPAPKETGLSEKALLSEVSERFIGEHEKCRNDGPDKTRIKIKIDPDDLKLRVHILTMIRMQAPTWLGSVKNPEDFYLSLANSVADYLTTKPAEPADLVNARITALILEKVRLDNATRLAVMNAAEKKPLTYVSESSNIEDVKPKLPALLKRIKKATEPRGTKTQLAKFLDVPLSKVSQWLAGENEPGGETTLRLLHWVEQQERQKIKSPGSASTPPEPKDPNHE